MATYEEYEELKQLFYHEKEKMTYRQLLKLYTHEKEKVYQAVENSIVNGEVGENEIINMSFGNGGDFDHQCYFCNRDLPLDGNGNTNIYNECKLNHCFDIKKIWKLMKEIENKNRKKAQIRKNRGYRPRKKSWGQKKKLIKSKSENSNSENIIPNFHEFDIHF